MRLSPRRFLSCVETGPSPGIVVWVYYLDYLSTRKSHQVKFFITHPLLDSNKKFLIRLFCEENESQRSVWSKVLHSPAASALLRPNILLSTLFLNTLNPYTSLIVREQIWHPYKTADKITVWWALLDYLYRWQVGRQKFLNCLISNIALT